MTLTDLVPTLQLSIGPVILISGVGLVLLSMTNRFGRMIDRSRLLIKELREAPEADRERIRAELRVLANRAEFARVGIALAALSILLASLLIIGLFVGVLFGLPIAAAVIALFVLCLLCLIASLLFFIVDINLSLRALWMELPGRSKQ